MAEIDHPFALDVWTSTTSLPVIIGARALLLLACLVAVSLGGGPTPRGGCQATKPSQVGNFDEQAWGIRSERRQACARPRVLQSQAGDRHLKFQDFRDNPADLVFSAGEDASCPPVAIGVAVRSVWAD